MAALLFSSCGMSVEKQAEMNKKAIDNNNLVFVEYLFKVTPMWNYGWFADEEVRFNKKSADPFVLIYRYEDIMFPNPDSAILDDLEAEVEADRHRDTCV